MTRMKRIKRLCMAILVAATAVALLPVTASAATATGPDFGQHVANCAELMGGFSGSHNPGVHHGFAGWDGSTCTA